MGSFEPSMEMSFQQMQPIQQQQFQTETLQQQTIVQQQPQIHQQHLQQFQQQQQLAQQNGADFECRRYTTPEGCPYGSKCRFKHGPFDDRDLTQQTSALGSKTKPCTKFFRQALQAWMQHGYKQHHRGKHHSACSTSGCPYGEGCHFLHYVPGGINSLTFQAVNGSAIPGAAGANNPATTQAEGCRFGDKCHFAHGESDLRPSNTRPASQLAGQTATFMNGATMFSSNPVATSVYYGEPTPPGVPAATTFGNISVTRMSIEAAYAGAIIGKAGANVKQISKVTGCKVSIRDHETDPNMRNVEMEGSLEQIESASEMVRQLLQTREVAPPRAPALGSHNFKTKLCENYSSGTCTFAERCHFAHGTQELRPP